VRLKSISRGELEGKINEVGQSQKKKNPVGGRKNPGNGEKKKIYFLYRKKRNQKTKGK